MNTNSEPPGREQIQAVWNELTCGDHDRLYNELRSDILRRIDEGCKKQINAGNYDASVSLSVIFEWFQGEYLTDDSPFVKNILESDAVYLETIEYDRIKLGHLVLERIVADLENDDEVIYIYDRQRVRSQVAEMARYFALIRQRLNEGGGTEINFSPSLVKMVKMDIIDREQPIIDPERASRFGSTLRNINRRISGSDVVPAAEFQETLGEDWRDAVSETVEFMGEFFNDGLPDQFKSLADYQAESFVELYLDAVTQDEGDRSHVITASTGGGKTEAFLFPILAYCHTTWKAGIPDNNAVLTYPRQDLCNNQFERLVDYAFTINQLLGHEDAAHDDAPISVSIQHGARNDVEIECPYCNNETKMEPLGYDDNYRFACTRSDDHVLDWVTADRSAASDIIVTTQDSLHLRLMDRYGKQSLWSSGYPTKFLVLDEVHVYTEQAGMHVSNVVRRFKRALRHRNNRQQPTLVASSATIHDAKGFTSRIFDTETTDLHEPADDEKESTGSEYMIFVKSTDPRDEVIPLGDAVFKPREEWEWSNTKRTTASNLSCMIQIGFAFQHTVRKEHAGDRENLTVDKNRILGFVDSIDSVGRLGNDIDDAENERGLFEIRRPDAFLQGDGKNPDCPSERFRGNVDDEFDERAVCEHVVPNAHLNKCSTYEAGECWWTMRDLAFDLEPANIAIHKSGSRQRANQDRPATWDPQDEWEQLIATSALEVGFDHPSIIGTFQYRAPMSVPSFLQRKGRGGRDSEDKPVTVVVLGSTSTDSFYFHHSEYLSDPRDEHLEIPLDEDNQFVRNEHMTAAVFDYFNVNDNIDSERIYRGSGSGQKGPDIERLQDEVNIREDDLREWLRSGFDEDADQAELILSELEDYLGALNEPIAPGTDDTPFWKAFRDAVAQTQNRGSSSHIDELARSLRGIGGGD